MRYSVCLTSATSKGQKTKQQLTSHQTTYKYLVFMRICIHVISLYVRLYNFVFTTDTWYKEKQTGFWKVFRAGDIPKAFHMLGKSSVTELHPTRKLLLMVDSTTVNSNLANTTITLLNLALYFLPCVNVLEYHTMYFDPIYPQCSISYCYYLR